MSAAPSVEWAEVPRYDVAAVLAAVPAHEDLAGLTFEVVAGDRPVEEAVTALLEVAISPAATRMVSVLSGNHQK